MSMNLRRKPRISYHEIEEPDFDEYIYCDECNDYVFEYCSIHGTLLVLPDDKVPSPTGFPPFVPHAALTIPHEFLHLAHSSIPGAGLGVFATLTLPKGVRFGPYRGERTKEANSDYCWQIYSGSSGRRPSCVVDAHDAQRSNWMRYVNCSRHCAEQNLVAYQYRGQLYYRTIKIIPRFTELMVFYGAEFARSLHINLRLYNTVEGFLQLIEATLSKKTNLNSNTSDSEKLSVVVQASSNTALKKQSVVQTSNDNDIQSTSPSDNINNEVTEDKPPNKSQLPDSKRESKNSTKKPEELNVNSDIKTCVKTSHSNQDTNNNSLLSSEKAHSCNICEYRTGNAKILERHLRAHAAEKKFCCDICSYITTDRSHIERHIISHSGLKCFACNICVKIFTRKYNLHQHIRTHTGERPYVCNICTKTFNDKGHLNRHIRTHTGERPYSCNICAKKFTEKGSLQKHIRTHTGDRPYACNVCEKTFSKKDSLKKHTRTHTGERPYSCNICAKKFTEKGSLQKHIRTHTGERPYSCNICAKNFTAKSSLHKHIRTHTGERPYVCNICTKTFNKTGNLKTHIRTHTNEKPYACNVCEKTFTRKYDLHEHITIHTDEKRYTCEICDKCFTLKRSLKRHVIKVHAAK